MPTATFIILIAISLFFLTAYLFVGYRNSKEEEKLQLILARQKELIDELETSLNRNQNHEKKN